MKKSLIFLLAAALVLCMSIPALAAGTTETLQSDNGISITISNVVDIALDVEDEYSAVDYYYCEAPTTITLISSSSIFSIIVQDESLIDMEADNVWHNYFDDQGVKEVPFFEDGVDMGYSTFGAGSYWVVNQPGTYWLTGVNAYLVVAEPAPDAEPDAEPAPETAPLPAPISEPTSKTVNPTASTVYVNGEATAFEAYNIEGNNYFKLRDLALVLNGTEKQFEIGYDEETKAITLTAGQAYTEVGGEMAAGDGTAKIATPTASKIYLDGAELALTVYNINGNNFFKLRDLMQAINVYVGYDEETKNITLDTAADYLAE